MIIVTVGLYTVLLCWLGMFYIVVEYALAKYHHKKQLEQAPDCCMCGAQTPQECGNHQYVDQADGYDEKYAPKYR